jgi:hypothetical protein
VAVGIQQQMSMEVQMLCAGAKMLSMFLAGGCYAMKKDIP